ncbi:MAG: ATP-binding protein [Bacteroidales bacterium]|nr:ATP-binding protein [Bacteroidales bacterium]
MEQRSNVQYRAEKEYKNSREKFYFLLREIISNSIQAVLIRKDKEKNNNYTPEIKLDISFDDKQCSILLRDNGEGFTEINSQCFDELDKKNTEKEKYHYHPLGQGRLAIVYFTDKANYETVYKNSQGKYKKKTFPYPSQDDGLFKLFDINECDTTESETYTELRIEISKQQRYNRAKTFFKKYESINELKQWFIETFFPDIVSNEDILIHLSYNNESTTISQKSIELETEKLDFPLPLYDESYDFRLWLIKNKESLRGDNTIVCFARNLKAELTNGKMSYSIDSKDGYLLYLTSEFFDENVDNKGEKIEISADAISAINDKINELLDERFKEIIENNQRETKKNLKKFRKNFPSLEAFISDDGFGDNKRIVSEEDIVKAAIDTKGKFEKRFWNKINTSSIDTNDVPYDESEECQKLLNSSLHIYVKHRECVLQRLYEMIKKYDDEGNDKPELESAVQELLFKRGETLKDSKDINHLHNLWILDDKFTTFSDTFKAKSTKPGQELSDIYIWADDINEVKQLLILELKSTTNAHNAGSSKEGMIAQVKRYARDFYKNPTKRLNWDVNTNTIQYLGIILARKSDISKELTSNSAGGNYKKIPFLKSSYYKDDEFATSDSPDDMFPIRIELYSFEDIYKLASNRNDVFFRLLRNEFGVEE